MTAAGGEEGPGRDDHRSVTDVALRPGVISATVGDMEPDLATVERLAWLRLLAERLDFRLEVAPVTPQLRSLLALVGLEDVVLSDPPADADGADTVG